MKFALLLVLSSLSTLAVTSLVSVHERRENPTCDPNGWVQNPSGCATFTSAHNCATPCKHYVCFRVSVVLHGVHAERDVLLQHAA